MFHRAIQVTILWAGLFAVAACTSADTKVRSPHWDKDGCARCRMAVSEPPAAAQLVGKGGLARYYDDLGCLIEDQASKPELAHAIAYVLRPGSSEQWVKAEQQLFAAGARTPMGFGYLPSQQGQLSWSQVVQAVRSAGRPQHGAH